MHNLRRAPPGDPFPLSGHIARLVSFDYLRLFAMLLVTVQHGMTVFGYYEQTTWANINLGQSGVGIFCAISGYLAFFGGMKPPLPARRWLQKRLWQIYPAYWLATIAAFALAWIAKTKPIDSGLFLSQMLGAGYFTHGWELVNVVSWFISLILLCYVIAFFGKWLGAPRITLAVAAIISTALLVTHSEVALSRHVLTFCIAGLLAQTRPRPRVILPIIAGLLVAAIFWFSFFYAAFSIGLLALALAWQIPETRLSRLASTYVYEYFLVHGIFLAALARFVPESKLLSGAIAVILAMISAVVLQKLAARLVGWVRREGASARTA